MYCKLYIHCESVAEIVSVLETYFGTYSIRISTCYFAGFNISIRKNKEADSGKIHVFPDGFLFYEMIAELEIYDDHIVVTDKILRILWKHHMPTVASCDYEEELNRFVLQA